MTFKQLPASWFNTIRTAFQSPTGIGWALVISQIAVLVWWGVALLIRQSDLGIPVWYDQQTTFTQTIYHLDAPYQIRNFANPPWAAVLLAPFSLPPLELAVLAQLSLYYAILTGIIYKFGGGRREVILTVTSFVALSSTLELNIGWLVCLGLLIPRRWSAPLVVVKPQLALGYFLSFSRRDFIQTMLFLVIVSVIAVGIWGMWPLMMQQEASRILGRANYNIAPSAVLPVPVSWGIGLLLGWRAFKRRDPIDSILTGMFFVPYIPFYSLLLPLALLAVRYFRLALIITVSLWILYGGAIVLYLF